MSQPARERWARLGSTLRPSRRHEVEEELAFHLELRARELEDRGLAPAEARRRALAGFGDLPSLARRCRALASGRDRRRRGHDMLDSFAQDLVYAWRQLRRSPLFAVAAVATLALGIGATTTLFALLKAVVLEPLPFPRPERLVEVSSVWRGRPGGNVSVGNFDAIRRGVPAFEAIAGLRWSSFNLADEGEPERVIGGRTTHELFPVLGVEPALGRVFAAEEDQPGRDGVVVLSHRLWARRFGADPAIVGRTLRIDGEPRSVLGVMPASFDVTADAEELWVPAAFTPERLAMYDEHYLTLYARLAPGVTAALAAQQLDAVASRLAAEHPQENTDRRFAAVDLTESFLGESRERLWLLLGAVGLVLLVACANVAGLQLARGAVRARELAVRTAIGAGRARLVRQLVTESAFLALLGALAGAVLAGFGIRLLVANAPPGVPRLEQATLDPTVLAFAVAVAVVSGVAFGLFPAWRLARPEVREALAAGGRGVRTARGRDRARTMLVVAEVALSLTVLAGGGLLLRTAANLGLVAPGYRPQGVLAARVSLPKAAFPTAESAATAFTRLAAELDGRPGVAAAGVSSSVPLTAGGGSNGLVPEGWDFDKRQFIDTRLAMVSPGYFAALGMELERGRFFTPDDRRSAPLVMVVNRTFADRAWPGDDPIGKRVACCEGEPDDPRWKTVVGVVADVRTRGPAVLPQPEFFLPLEQAPPDAWDWIQRSMAVVARAETGSPASLAAPMRETLAEVAPGVPLFDLRSMEERQRRVLAPQRFYTWLLVVFGAIALFLAAVGLYGLVAAFVDERRPEIGVRLALGATRRAIGGLVVAHSLRPVAAGILLGLALAAAATRALESLLRGVTPTDPATFAAVALLLVAVGAVAAVVPARRAARTDPARVLASG